MRHFVTILAGLMIISCAHRPSARQPLQQRSRYIMGTLIHIKLAPAQKKSFAPSFQVFEDLDKKLSTYKKDSEISQLNRRKKAKVSSPTRKAIVSSLRYARETKGYFSPALGALTKNTYNSFSKQTPKPSKKRIKQALKNTGRGNISLQKNIVTLKNKARLDLGGIGKGFAVDQAAQLLQRRGVKRGILAASGDIRCVHRCRMRIRHPYAENKKLARFKMKKPGMSVSTSGTYERKIPGTKIHHLLNPKTGKPQTHFVSVTLLTQRNNTRIDAFATAVGAMPLNKALSFLTKHEDIYYLLVTTKNIIYLDPRWKEVATEPAWRFSNDEFRIKNNVVATEISNIKKPSHLE